MDYRVEHDAPAEGCTVHVTGTLISPEDTRTLQLLTASLFTEHGQDRILVDLTDALVRSGTLQAYNAGNPQGGIAPTLRRLRIAVLYKELGDHENFLETVAVNRGFTFRVFDDPAAAEHWLSLSA